MHKVFEVRIGKNRTPNGCGFIWPDWWGEVHQGVDVVAYQDDGLDEEGAVCVCATAIWDKIAAKNDPKVTQLTEEATNERGRAWRPQAVRITDQERILLITAKVALGQAISSEERKALDPEDPSPGVNKSPVFNVRKIIAEKEK